MNSTPVKTGENTNYDTGARRDNRIGKGRFDLISPFMLDRLAKWYEGGAVHYGDRNWEKGMPYSVLIDSALRHINKLRIGSTDEDHLIAAIWNLTAIAHFDAVMPEMNNLPSYIQSRVVERTPEIKEFGQ